jgi:hypothetical protein
MQQLPLDHSRAIDELLPQNAVPPGIDFQKGIDPRADGNRWAILGSGLLAADIVATLKSGSPPSPCVPAPSPRSRSFLIGTSCEQGYNSGPCLLPVPADRKVRASGQVLIIDRLRLRTPNSKSLSRADLFRVGTAPSSVQSRILLPRFFSTSMAWKQGTPCWESRMVTGLS